MLSHYTVLTQGTMLSLYNVLSHGAMLSHHTVLSQGTTLSHHAVLSQGTMLSHVIALSYNLPIHLRSNDIHRGQCRSRTEDGFVCAGPFVRDTF